MRTDKIEVSITIKAPFDQPDKNGVIYTREAIMNALQNAQAGLPIIQYLDNDTLQAIGITTCKPYAIQFDGDAQICCYSVDGKIFFGGTECDADIEDGIVKSFEITGYGFSR